MTCENCVFKSGVICLLTLKAAPGQACDDYEEPKAPREKAKEVWG